MKTSTLKSTTQLKKQKKAQYSIEFFHIYTDEKIGDVHTASLDYLKGLQKSWGDLSSSLIVLIDDYNPTKHTLSKKDVIDYLTQESMIPHFWAMESAMVPSANILLEEITDKKLQNSYRSYIAKNKKYPCSLLTAAWYLTRLGQLDDNGVINGLSEDIYIPADRLINILPSSCKQVEKRTRKLILKSKYADLADNIQDLFYPTYEHGKADLF